MRVTGGRAQAYLGHDGHAGRVLVRAYSGEPRLGPVSGRLVVERVEPDGQPTPAGEGAFSLARPPGSRPGDQAALAGPLRGALKGARSRRLRSDRAAGRQWSRGRRTAT